METEDGKKATFDLVYDTYVDKVYNVAFSYTKDHYTAEDITQRVFVKFYRYMDKINMQTINAWLLTAAKHMSMNYLRDNKRLESLEGLENAERFLALEGVETKVFMEYRRREVVELTKDILTEIYLENPQWYEVLMLTYVYEKPQKEVAASMGVSVEALHSMLYRAKKWIKKHYGEQFQHTREI